MTQEITEITDGNPLEMMSERTLLLECVRSNREVAARLASMDATLAKLISAGANGGARGFRQALGEVANGRG